MILFNPTTRDRYSQTELKHDHCATSKSNEAVKRFGLAQRMRRPAEPAANLNVEASDA
jgi:hypothetical protein